jgi:hypothetical protein
MASPFSGKKRPPPPHANPDASIAINTAVYRFFGEHELSGKPAQWIHGRVTGYKQQAAKGRTRAKKCWTVSFDSPVPRPLTCDGEEVIGWKTAADNFRHKKSWLDKQIGKELVVSWSVEDRDLCLTEWEGEYGMCTVTKVLANTQQCVLRYRCGWKKFVEGDELIHMLDENDALIASKHKRTYNKVLQAIAEKSSRSAITEKEPVVVENLDRRLVNNADR